MQLLINGAAHEVSAEGEMPLLWVLRDVLGMTGTKFGCGIAQCGACMVLINGEAVLSCQITLADVDGPITTIEGLEENGQLHMVQQAWLEHQVPQCGYCQPGQILQAIALLSETPAPSDEDIDAAMAGNLCRCGAYTRIRQAIKTAAEKLQEQA